MGACPSRKQPVRNLALTDDEDASLLSLSPADAPRKWGLRLVCLSDTHNQHRKIKVPAGDVLVHAGDFTAFGKRGHAEDFNAWLGELPHKLKLVVVGNHENNAEWRKSTQDILSNAILLRQTGHEMPNGPRFFGTDFFWPCPSGNPYFDQIAGDTDVLIAHGPAKGCVDGGKGCDSLLEAVRRVQPAVVISGHVHFARGASELRHQNGERTVLLNAANCGSGNKDRSYAQKPIVIDI